MSGGNGTKTTESASYAALGFRASAGGKRKRFNTEGSEVGAQSSQRRGAYLARLASELLVAVTGYGVVVHHPGGLHQRVANRGADEPEATLYQVLA